MIDPNSYGTPMQRARMLAVTNPRLAYWLAQDDMQNKLLGFQTMEHTFDNGTTAQPAQTSFPTVLGEDFYPVDLRSTVQRPEYAAGNIYKPQSDYFNALQSGIWVKMEVVGGLPGRNYMINQQFTPLEIIAPNANSTSKSIICGLGSVLEYSQNVRTDLTLRRTYQASELPALLGISFVGWSLGCQGYFSVPLDKACSHLRGLPEMEGLKIVERAHLLCPGGIVASSR